MSEFGDFLYQSARPLPVILLLDTSGSMSSCGNIDTMKNAVREMLQNFKQNSNTIVSIQVAIITFGAGGAKVIQPLTDASNINVECMANATANGGTPMGDAITLAKQIVDDKKQVPSRAYTPTIVVVTDGWPNDNWEQPLNEFINSGRSAKCDRMAMGIGSEAQNGPAHEVLQKFISRPENLFGANDASQISEFFRFVTMSTITRTRSTNPNAMVDNNTILKTVKKTASIPGVVSQAADEEDDFPF